MRPERGPAAWLASLRERGVSVSATKAGKLRVSPRSALTAGERAYLASQARAVCALLEVDASLRAEAEQSEREATALVQESERRHRERQRQHRRDVMACWSLAKVRAMAEAGKLTAADVEEWREARSGRAYR